MFQPVIFSVYTIQKEVKFT